MSHTITSKRKLLSLVENGYVSGWDDPRMPTISGLKRRGYTPDALKKFVSTAGVAKRENVIEMSLLEFCVREDLNKKCNRLMVVQDPLKITISITPIIMRKNSLWLIIPKILTQAQEPLFFRRNFLLRDQIF